VVDHDFSCDGATPLPCPDSNKTVCGSPATECSKPCTPGFSGDGAPALEMRMGQPMGQPADPVSRLVYDSAGNLIFSDTRNHRIRRIDSDGIVTTMAGTGDAGYSGASTPMARSRRWPVSATRAPTAAQGSPATVVTPRWPSSSNPTIGDGWEPASSSHATAPPAIVR
jgi:hypothetical protein